MLFSNTRVLTAEGVGKCDRLSAIFQAHREWLTFQVHWTSATVYGCALQMWCQESICWENSTFVLALVSHLQNMHLFKVRLLLRSALFTYKLGSSSTGRDCRSQYAETQHTTYGIHSLWIVTKARVTGFVLSLVLMGLFDPRMVWLVRRVSAVKLRGHHLILRHVRAKHKLSFRKSHRYVFEERKSHVRGKLGDCSQWWEHIAM